MLKTDLHMHSSEDKEHHLKLSAKQLIDIAAERGFEVLAITHHRYVYYSKGLSDYAKKRNILLIPGSEAKIGGKEILLYNVTQKEVDSLKTLDDLRSLKKRKNILVIAPHPFFKWKTCIGNRLIEYIDLFDAIEYSYFYTWFLNFNRKGVKVAKKFGKALVGNSDIHYLFQLEKTYSLIDSKKDMASVFKAIRNGRVKVVSKPVSLKHFIWRTYKMVFHLE